MKLQKHNNQAVSGGQGMIPLTNMVNRLFNESFLFPGFADTFFSDPFFSSGNHTLQNIKVDIQESENEFNIKAELPGVDPEKIDLDISDTGLTLSAEMGNKKEEVNENYIKKECTYGKVQRSFDFRHTPIDSDNCKANFENGILQITLPKKKKDEGTWKKIPINA